MNEFRDRLRDIVLKHEERMKSDPRYAMAYEAMKAATVTVDRPRHYDRDGYCDNPARGY
ncbi:hypothetical protein [Shinella fusca]|uniref:Uncharacterized protein n=1 Tax=Shinella fusca TaxID=544480 RepID=A0A7W8DST1_9HYPH|nr:hypothetical protein [Shinella fusca]MBB5040817.1 hypothetical protein [Shinella fusca]